MTFMNINEAVEAAVVVREKYRELENLAYGREWSINDLAVGLMGDVGDLAQLIGAQQGIRPAPENLRDALGHELSDILWSVFVLSDEFGIDMDKAFGHTMAMLEERVESKIQRVRDIKP